MDMVELEGLETGSPAADAFIWLLGYFNELGAVAQDNVKEYVKAETKSDEFLNNNPVYSQQTKDVIYSARKITASANVAFVYMDPAVQIMNSVSPIDDMQTLTTGQIYDITGVRDATTLEKVFAGVEVVAFFFDVSVPSSVMKKPIQKIVTEGGEEFVEKASKEIIEESIQRFSHNIDEVTEKSAYSSIESSVPNIPDVDIIAHVGEVKDGVLQIKVDVVPRTVMEGEELLEESHKRLMGQYGSFVKDALDEIAQELMKKTGTKKARVYGERATGARKGKIQEGTTTLKE